MIRPGCSIERLLGIDGLLIFTRSLEVQDVQIVQAVQDGSEEIEGEVLFGRLIVVYFDPFIPLRFR